LTPSKRLQNVKSSKKIDYIRRFAALQNQPDKTKPEPGHLFRVAQKVPRMPSLGRAAGSASWATVQL
jgi:hypothetical protein